uniref:Virion structural protein n=1 Tax=Pseudomonas phage RVTF4 TaxID=3236931 RepID=A0AB39CCQ3_9VIRU
MDQEIENPLLPDPAVTSPDVEATQSEVTTDLLTDPVVDYPIENTGEMIELVNDPAPQTIDVIPADIAPAMAVAVEAIDTLLDMHATIRMKGVSSHDMEGLKSLNRRLVEHNLHMPSAGLEDYGYFTPERSLLNKQVSLESITKTILETIKAWIRKLVELVMQGYRWVKGLKQKHAVLDQQLVKARDVLLGVRKIYGQMKVINSPMGAEASRLTAELTTTALVTGPLERNKLTLYGFSQEGAEKAVKNLFASAKATSESIATRVNNLADLMGNKEIPSDDGLCGLQDLASLVQSVDEMTVISDDPDYLAKELGVDFWEGVEKFRKVTVIDFDELVKYYGSTADALGRIRTIKIDDVTQADRAQTIINQITTAVNQLNKIVNFFNRAAQAQVAAAKTYREYYSQAVEVLMTDFVSKGPSADTKKEMKQLITAMQALK